MITQKDWLAIKKFAETRQRCQVVGPWGWETQECLPDPYDILVFIETTIGVKPHIEKVKQDGK